MSLREQFEAYRHQLASNLKGADQRLKAEMAELQAKISRFQSQYTRLEDQPSTDDACPACFFDGRNPSALKPAPSPTGKVDIFRCSQCGHETEVEA